MEIHNFTLTKDELLGWINTLSSVKKKHVRQCFGEAERHGGVFFDQIEKIKNQFCFTVLIYRANEPHEIETIFFVAPATSKGLADLVSELHKINVATGGIF